MRMSEESWDRVVETNLKGTFLATRLALRHMTRARWGRDHQHHVPSPG